MKFFEYAGHEALKHKIKTTVQFVFCDLPRTGFNFNFYLFFSVLEVNHKNLLAATSLYIIKECSVKMEDSSLYKHH
jgi:hypothetical protein